MKKIFAYIHILFLALLHLSLCAEKEEPSIEFTIEVSDGKKESDQVIKVIGEKANINSIVPIFFNYFSSNSINTENIEMIIDGGEIQAFKSEVSFDKAGEHTVKYIIKDEITDMYQMCRGSKYLKKVKFGHLKTSRVRSMERAFEGCWGLKEVIGLENLNTESLVNVGAMFMHCWALETVNIASLIGPKVTDISFMFASCTLLKGITWTSIDTSSVKYVNQMFTSCLNLEKLDISSWDLSNASSFNEMFFSNKQLVLTLKDDEQYQILKENYPQFEKNIRKLLFIM